MRYVDYSHRHGRELLQLLHPDIVTEIRSLLQNLPPYNHGAIRNRTAKDYLVKAFLDRGWEAESRIDLKTSKGDYVDLWKGKVAIEIEFSRFEMFFRDFFRFMLLYEHGKIDVGVIITYDEMAYQRWTGEAKSYKSARASLDKLVDFLKGDYSSVVRVPLWCIGIE